MHKRFVHIPENCLEKRVFANGTATSRHETVSAHHQLNAYVPLKFRDVIITFCNDTHMYINIVIVQRFQ